MKQLLKSFFKKVCFTNQVAIMADGNRSSRRRAKRLVKEKERKAQR